MEILNFVGLLLRAYAELKTGKKLLALDLCIILSSFKLTLNQFNDYINSLYPTIKFELVYSERELHVLDLTLYLIDGFIRTDVYSKPTDSHLYLPPSSCHPKHVFKAIPFGVATRLKRNFPCRENS